MYLIHNVVFYTQNKNPNEKGLYRISESLISPSYSKFVRANIA
jgi:hypothetical protein